VTLSVYLIVYLNENADLTKVRIFLNIKAHAAAIRVNVLAIFHNRYQR